MAKFLQNLTCMTYLPAVAKQRMNLPKYDKIFFSHLSIPVFSSGMNSKLRRYILNGDAEQTVIQSCIYRSCNTTSYNNKSCYTVTFELASGKKYTVNGKEGETLLDVVNRNNLEIIGFGVCQGTINCNSCHVIFKNEDYNKIDSLPSDEEQDMLTTVNDVCNTSRLCCQVILSKAIDGVKIRVPELVYWSGVSDSSS